LTLVDSAEEALAVALGVARDGPSERSTQPIPAPLAPGAE
jgi:hypothetical protein